MANNVTANLGSGGPVFATDDISNVHYPISKVAWGAEDVANVVTAAKPLPVDLPNGSFDTFGKQQIVSSINDVDVQFFRDVPANLVTITTAGGGSASQTTGLMQLSTSTGTTGEAKAVSADSTIYRSGGEIFALFTVAWLDGGVAGCNQRIGLYDTNNGFFVGYEGTTFGATVRTGASDTQTAKASFNVDTLTGAAGSLFTRNGTPEAIDLAKLNVFRIRFGWLGAAPVKFEVLSPDGTWVLFHVIKQPNLSATPHIQNADLPITAHVVKTSGATNIRLNTACWGAGSTYDKPDINGSYTLGTATNSAVNYNTNGIGTLRIRCGTTTTGNFTIEGTTDGVNWVTHPQVVRVSSGAFDSWVNAAETPAAGANYVINCVAYRAVRVRTSSTLGATVVLYHNGESEVLMLKAMDLAPAPHNFGYTQVSKTVTASTAQTGTAIWTPASGKRLVITQIHIQSFGTTAGTCVVWFGGAADTTYTRNTDYAIFDGEFAPSTTNKPGVFSSGLWISPTADFVLRYTTTNAQSINITVWGYEA